MDSSKREQLLDLMLVELAEKGNADSSLTAVLNAAGVSEEEFAEEFADRDAFLFAAYDQLTGEIQGRMQGHCAGVGSWPERVRAGLSSLLDEVAARPAMATVVTLAFQAIRPTADRRYSGFLLSGLAPLVREGRAYSGIGDELPDGVELFAVGAAESLIFSEIEAGRAQHLPAMMPEVLFSILVPFLGPDRAEDAIRQAPAAI